MILRLAIPVIGFVFFLTGCVVPREPIIYAGYQSIVVGDFLPPKIELPEGVEVDRDTVSWEAKYNSTSWAPPWRGIFCLEKPTITEKAYVVTDLDGKVILKHYELYQKEDYWWFLRKRWRWRKEWELWSPTEYQLPIENDCLSELIRDVMSRCSRRASMSYLIPLFERVRDRGYLDGQDFSYEDSTMDKPWYTLGTTSVEIRILNRNTVSISMDNVHQTIWILWFVLVGWNV